MQIKQTFLVFAAAEVFLGVAVGAAAAFVVRAADFLELALLDDVVAAAAFFVVWREES